MDITIHEINGDTSSLLGTLDGSKVYYTVQGALSKYEDRFQSGADGGVTAKSGLPPELNLLAKYLTLGYLVEGCNLDTDKFKELANKLGDTKEEVEVILIWLALKLDDEHGELFEIYDCIEDIN